ncbi:MAG: DNA polymerase III subunit alpha [Bacillota bacterium]|jgi:error-prone DNA polymerase
MFTHLHVHSPYSFLDGASKIENIVSSASSLGMKAIAITDHNNLSATVRFIKAAQNIGIKPIIGNELTLEGGYHLTVLCRNNQGYRNLCAILSESHLNNLRKEPKVSLSTLREHAEGLIALTGCRRGLIPQLILRKRYQKARQALQTYESVFGKNSLYIEMSETLLPGSWGLNAALSELAAVSGLRAVATNNVHYLSKDDFLLHDVLTCVRTLTKLEEVHPERRLNAENYLKSPEEMEREFKSYPDAIRATMDISGQCECPLQLGKSTFPSYELPKEFSSSKEFLRHLVFEGAASRYGEVTNEIRSRLDYELYVIEHLGYEDYFLVVWDLVRFAHTAGIRHAGRGSAADSAVAFCLGVTDVDPIAQNLLFERFMSLERGEKPDIDVDFDARRRDEVTSYVYRKYGSDHVASVATYNTFQARSVIRDVGKVMGYSPEEIDILAKRLPYWPASRVADAFSSVPELKDLKIPENKLKTLLSVAQRLADLPRFLSTHLGGLVISRNPVNWLSPVERSAKGVTILQFDKDDVEDLGLIKIDLLSLRTLGAVDDTINYLSKTSPVDYDRIPLNDEATFERLRKADTVGVFQLESPAQRSLQARLGADNIEDVVASVALIRPGPIKGDMVEPFIRRRQGIENVSYLEPRLEPILKKTYGVILFQEQVIEIASTIAGFSPGEADALRRVMTHMRSGEEMERIGEVFIRKSVEKGVPEKVAKDIFQCMKGYASYGFCEAHARAFATTAYKTAYLLEHYPAEFFASILNNEPMGFYPVSTVCVEAKRHGVGIRGVSVNHSFKDVTIEDGDIRLPLKMVKGMSQKDIESLVSERDTGGPFRSYSDFHRRVWLDSSTVKSLILCGAFDEFGLPRKGLLWALPDIVRDAFWESQAERLLDAPESHGVSEFLRSEKIAYECQILGFGVSGHPMEIWRGVLSGRGFVRSDHLGKVRPGEFIKVGGIPVRPHRPPTKSGRTVVFMSLEDECGLIDVTCFESVYKRYGKFLFPGEILPLGIWGQLQKRGNALSINARTVFPLSYVLNSRA